MTSDQIVAEAQARRLLYAYARACDRLDRELMKTLFWPDATADMGTIYSGGAAGFVEVALSFMGSMATTRHDIANILVSHDGSESCAAESYVTAWHRIDTPEGTRELIVLGRYLTRFARRGDEWRIIQHGEVLDWGRVNPTDPAWFEANGELSKGRRDRDDASYALTGFRP